MMQDSFDDDDVTRLLKKTQWPEAEKALRYRIELAVCGETAALAAAPQGFTVALSWGARENYLSFAGLVLALVIGFVSGVSGTNGKAVTSGQSDFYGVSGVSLTALYFGKN